MFAWKRTVVHKRVIVNCKTGTSLKGVLTAKRGPLLILRDVLVYEGGRTEPLRADGEVIVTVDNIDFIQAILEG